MSIFMSTSISTETCIYTVYCVCWSLHWDARVFWAVSPTVVHKLILKGHTPDTLYQQRNTACELLSSQTAWKRHLQAMFSATTNFISLKLTSCAYQIVKRPTVHAKLLDIFNLSIFSHFPEGM